MVHVRIHVRIKLSLAIAVVRDVSILFICIMYFIITQIIQRQSRVEIARTIQQMVELGFVTVF